MSNEVNLPETGGASRPQFHPELRRAALFIPRFSLGPKTTRLLRERRQRRPVPPPPVLEDVSIRDEYIEGPDGNWIRVRLFSPAGLDSARPALLWMHAGGFLFGHPEQDQAQNIEICRRLGIVVAAVAYRLGPEHPFPQPLDDCYSALTWLHAHAGPLNIDAGRIAVGGGSSGGCLAAGLTLLAHDRGSPPIAFQLLVYPGLDDRTALRQDIDERSLRICSAKSNRFGWRTYLGREAGGEGVSPYAAPSRRSDLSGLPPAWIGVGSCDLFHDEDVAYAARLDGAGVPCTLNIVEGAFHAFDLVAPKSQVVADFRRSFLAALDAALSANVRQDASPALLRTRDAVAA